MQPRSVNSVEDVSKECQGQGADYETPRSVLKVREEWRVRSNAEIGTLLRHLFYLIL